MKRMISAVTAIVLIVLSSVYGFSSEAYSVPEILSVKINEKSEYGYVD